MEKKSAKKKSIGRYIFLGICLIILVAIATFFILKFLDPGRPDGAPAPDPVSATTPSDSTAPTTTDTATDEFTLDVSARLAGTDDEWVKELSVTAGSEVELKLEYVNASDKIHLGVAVWAILPDSMSYVDDTTWLMGACLPEGGLVAENTVATEGLGIGNYVGKSTETPDGTGATLKLTAKIADDTPIGSILNPSIKISILDETNTLGVTITIVDDGTPIPGVTNRPADYTVPPEAQA